MLSNTYYVSSVPSWMWPEYMWMQRRLKDAYYPLLREQSYTLVYQVFWGGICMYVKSEMFPIHLYIERLIIFRASVMSYTLRSVLGYLCTNRYSPWEYAKSAILNDRQEDFFSSQSALSLLVRSTIWRVSNIHFLPQTTYVNTCNFCKNVFFSFMEPLYLV